MLEKLDLKFTYPKPIDLITYLVRIFSKGNDLVLDSFLGSGTTGNDEKLPSPRMGKLAGLREIPLQLTFS